MRTHLLAMALIVCDPPRAQAEPGPPRSRASLSASGGIRAERLSRKELKTWNSVVAIVMAEGPGGQPLYPTLRSLWDSVATSGHTVYVEMRNRSAPPSYLAGRFAITRVDPEGKAHEAILILNFRAVDNVSTGPTARRANGFIPLAGLGRKERYAELLGHELAHAAWSLADVERARLAARLHDEMEQHVRMLIAARAPGRRAEIAQHVAELERHGRVLEEPAEAAEALIWEELRAGRTWRPCRQGEQVEATKAPAPPARPGHGVCTAHPAPGWRAGRRGPWSTPRAPPL
jgi:hypothetical protein